MSVLEGTPSDECPAILATGRTDVTTIYTSLSKRHPDGRDADYLEWHSLDHRPEQHRLAQLRASFRMVSTPACRAARAASDERYDEADHLQSYFFAGLSAMDSFNDLSVALRDAGRAPYLLPMVERAVYRLDGTAAAPRIKVGADVLLWWSAKGVYFMIERGGSAGGGSPRRPGCGRRLVGRGRADGAPLLHAGQLRLHVSYLFLDDEPAEVARRLRPRLEQRWSGRAMNRCWPRRSTASWPTSGTGTAPEDVLRSGRRRRGNRRPMARTFASETSVDRAGLEAFIRPRHHAILTTQRRDGSPQMSPVTMGVGPDGVMLVASYPERAKVHNIRRHGHATLCVLSDDFGGEWAQVSGAATVVDLPEAVEGLVTYFRSISGEHPDWDEYRRAMVDQGKVVIRIAVERWGPISRGGFPARLGDA